MTQETKVLILKYMQLAAQGLTDDNSKKILEQMKKISNELNLTHEQIIQIGSTIPLI